MVYNPPFQNHWTMILCNLSAKRLYYVSFQTTSLLDDYIFLTGATYQKKISHKNDNIIIKNLPAD